MWEGVEGAGGYGISRLTLAPKWVVNMKRIYAILFISLVFVLLFNLNTFAQKDNAEHISIILPTESIAKFVTRLLPYEINMGENISGSFLIKSIDNLKIEDFTGLHKRSPFLAITLATALFALAGIPPFVGFTGKFMLLVNAFRNGYTIPVILAAINTGIAIYYYLSVVRIAYCTDPEKELSPISQPWPGRVAAIILLMVIVVMGIMPARFLDLATAAVSTLLS